MPTRGFMTDVCVCEMGKRHNLTDFIAVFRLFSSVQFKMVSKRSEKPIIIRSEVSPTLPLKRFQCSSDSDDGPLSSFQGWSFNGSLLQTIDGVMSLALCPPVMSQASQHFRSSEKQATCEGCFFPAGLSARSFPFTMACLQLSPRDYCHLNPRGYGNIFTCVLAVRVIRGLRTNIIMEITYCTSR